MSNLFKDLEDVTLGDLINENIENLSYEVTLACMTEDELDEAWEKLFEERRRIVHDYNYDKGPAGSKEEEKRRQGLLNDYKILTKRMNLVEERLTLYDSIGGRK